MKPPSLYRLYALRASSHDHKNVSWFAIMAKKLDQPQTLVVLVWLSTPKISPSLPKVCCHLASPNSHGIVGSKILCKPNKKMDIARTTQQSPSKCAHTLYGVFAWTCSSLISLILGGIAPKGAIAGRLSKPGGNFGFWHVCGHTEPTVYPTRLRFGRVAMPHAWRSPKSSKGLVPRGKEQSFL